MLFIKYTKINPGNIHTRQVDIEPSLVAGPHEFMTRILLLGDEHSPLALTAEPHTADTQEPRTALLAEPFPSRNFRNNNSPT